MPGLAQREFKRIVIVGPTPPPYHGGALSTQLILNSPTLERYRLLHLDTADRRGIDNIGTFDWRNVTLALWHSMWFLGLLVHHRPDLVYIPISQGTAGYLRDLTFLLPSRWLHFPTIVHLRGGEFRDFYAQSSPVMRALIRYSLGTVQRVIVLGENLRGLFIGLVPIGRVVVIPNGTPDFVRSLLRTPKTGGHLRGLFLSNLRPRKGVFVALEAAITALHRFRELEFVFAGAWEAEVDRAQALAQLRDCEVANRIHFVGTVVAEEKHRLLLASDFLVFPPTKPEGHPRVLLEAMAAGLPVITTDQGAIVETVAEGKTGFIVEPGNAAAIVDRITFLIEHPDARRCMGQAARERFLAHYTAEASNARLAALFAEVLSQA